MSNPDDTRRAVALTYTTPSPPKVVATGQGEVAEAIIAKARESGVPIEENPLLVDALSRLELDETIPEELYRAVAAVITAILRASWRN